MLRRGQLIFLLVVLTLSWVVFVPAHLRAAATGQIKGVLTDDEGNPVIGASVQIKGTTRGAQSDMDGRYIITQVDPGTYTLIITHIQFAEMQVTEVNVKSDITSEVNARMKLSTVEVDKIVVEDKRDILKVYETSTEVTVDAASIKTQPVTTVQDLLEQVAGVVTGRDNEIFIRGGRAGEVSYILDGVPVDDPLRRSGAQAGANLSLVSGSIQEFTVIKDGFDPEYGNAVSGIIKITTQTGSNDNTRMNAQFITDDFGNSDLNKYSRNNDYIRFSLSGPEPFIRSRILPALGLNFMRDKEFTYYFYAEMEKSDGFYQYNRFNTPATRKPEGFFNLLGIHVPERLQNRYHWMLNLKFRPQQNLKFIASYKETQNRSTLFDWQYLYTSTNAPVYENKLRVMSLEVLQSISPSMNYEAIVSWTRNATLLQPGDPDNPGHGINPGAIDLEEEWETYEDRNGNGIYDPPEPIINIFPDTALYGTDFTGPGYTHGEWNFQEDIQGGGGTWSGFRFNNNGYQDSLEGEPYIDLNGNGIWDQGDFLRDVNGNGILDKGRIPPVLPPTPEPFTDGDSIIGEPFDDVNGNKVFDPGVDGFTKCVCPENDDFNHNGKYDGPNDQWTPGTPYIDNNGNGLFDLPNNTYDEGEQFTDVNKNGRWDFGGNSQFFLPGTYDDEMTWRYTLNDTYRGEVKLFREMGAHQLKAGAAVQKHDFIWQEIQNPYVLYTGRNDGGPYSNRGQFRDMFEYKPWSGTVYLRDKLEYGSMIASLGLRWDFFIQDTDNLIPVAQNDDLGSGVILGDRQQLSPRIGFSYPISDKAKVHFNYGHFYQLPDFADMYARNTASVDQNAIVGNYNLDYIKTVQYSFGVKYAMSENYSLDVSGYFKDEFDKINAANVQIGGLTRQQYRNSDYGRSRGFELTLEKRGGGYVNGVLSYVYAFAFGKASEASREWQSETEILNEPLSEAALDDDIRHSLNATVQLFVPSTVKPRLFGMAIPNGWSLSVITLFRSGKPFTPARDYPNIVTTSGETIQRNSLRLPSTLTFDVRFTKDFRFVGLDWSSILWVENVFDSRNVLEVYTNTGRPDTRQNFSGFIFGGTPYDQNPRNWDYSRQIRMGLEVNL